MIPGGQKVRTDGQNGQTDGQMDGRTHGRRQNYIPLNSLGDNKEPPQTNVSNNKQ